MNTLENKYRKWYDQIIERAKTRNLTGYTERHHIVPKSLGGTNDPCNIARLTAREHLVCHLLLVKFTDGKDRIKMLSALWYLSHYKNNKICSRLYDAIKSNLTHTPETRQKISAYAKKRKLSPETIAKRTATRLASGKYSHHTPEGIERRAALRRGVPRTPEVKAKISAGHRRSRAVP